MVDPVDFFQTTRLFSQSSLGSAPRTLVTVQTGLIGGPQIWILPCKLLQNWRRHNTQFVVFFRDETSRIEICNYLVV